MKRESIIIDKSEGWKYDHVGSGESLDTFTAYVWVNDDGSINEKSYSKSYRDKLNKVETASPSNSSNRSSSSSNNSSSGNNSSSSSDDNGSCVKFIFTIIPILPIWWIIKLLIKSGAGIFVILWWFIRAVFYILSWPIRVLLYCCLDKEQRRFLPKWNYDLIPAYSFKKF